MLATLFLIQVQPTCISTAFSTAMKVNHSIYQTKQVPIFQLKPILGDFADGVIGLAHFSDPRLLGRKRIL